MLRWRLREIMAAKRITNRKLAAMVDMHEVTISKLKTVDTMPRIDGESLEKILKALDCKLTDLLVEDSPTNTNEYATN